MIPNLKENCPNVASLNGAFTVDRRNNTQKRPSVTFELWTFTSVSGKEQSLLAAFKPKFHLRESYPNLTEPSYTYSYVFPQGHIPWAFFFTVSRTNCVGILHAGPLQLVLKCNWEGWSFNRPNLSFNMGYMRDKRGNWISFELCPSNQKPRSKGREQTNRLGARNTEHFPMAIHRIK